MILLLLSSACADPVYKGPTGAPDSALDSLDAGPSVSDAAALVAVDAGSTTTPADADRPRGEDAARAPLEDASPSQESSVPEASQPVPDASLDDPDAAPAQPDAAAVDPAVPSWASSLSGRFAVQSFSFSKEGNVITTYRSRFLVEARASEAGTVLVAQDCEDTSSSALATARAAHPERLPPRTSRVQFQGDSFSTEAIDVTLGYEETPPPECAGKPGQRVAKRSFQTWIAGSTCTCPGDKIPPIDDCRVVDSDGDQLAGYTVIGNALGLGDSEVYGVSLSHFRYVNGRPSEGGGFTAQLDQKSTSLQYGCRPAGCANLTGTTAGCAPAQSLVNFVPLAGRVQPSAGWSCATLLERAGELFPGQPPETPASCM